MAPSFSRVSSGALFLALAYNARPVKADFWEDVENCKLVLDDLPTDLTTDFCHDWTYGYEPEDEFVTITGYPVTVTEYPDSKTCDDEGDKTTSKYPEPTPEPSGSYQPFKPTKVSETTMVPNESTEVHEITKAPYETTRAPDRPSATYVSGYYDVTVTSTTWTTYWTTSTIYPDYPAATPAPYRRDAVNMEERAAWCVDRPCRVVQYDDGTITEACKKYLGWRPHTSTVNVPGYTVTTTSYPTDCKKKDEGYQAEPYVTEAPEPYPSATAGYSEYPPEAPESELEPELEPYPPAPAPSAEDESEYDGTDDYQDSDLTQSGEGAFDDNYSDPDGPLPWDDVDQTSELADAIAAGSYDDAVNMLGLDDSPVKS